MPDFLTLLGNLIMSKISPKLMACFRVVVYHLSWLKIHETKRTTYDYHHLKGFQDISSYTRYTRYLLFATNPETPCRWRSPCSPSPSCCCAPSFSIQCRLPSCLGFRTRSSSGEGGGVSDRVELETRASCRHTSDFGLRNGENLWHTSWMRHASILFNQCLCTTVCIAYRAGL